MPGTGGYVHLLMCLVILWYLVFRFRLLLCLCHPRRLLRTRVGPFATLAWIIYLVLLTRFFRWIVTVCRMYLLAISRFLIRGQLSRLTRLHKPFLGIGLIESFSLF